MDISREKKKKKNTTSYKTVGVSPQQTAIWKYKCDTFQLAEKNSHLRIGHKNRKNDAYKKAQSTP